MDSPSFSTTASQQTQDRYDGKSFSFLHTHEIVNTGRFPCVSITIKFHQR